MKKKSKKLLVAVDGSEQAEAVINYICDFKPFREMSLVLFHVLSGIPEPYLDLGIDPRIARKIKEIQEWELQQKINIDAFMEKTLQKLIQAGFSPETINIRIRDLNEGISRDIILEAANGYHAVIVGRRGFGLLKEMVVGSVTRKVVDYLSAVPILIIGTKQANNRILLNFDGSDNAYRAIDFTSSITGKYDFKIDLLRIIRGFDEINPAMPYLFFPKPAYLEIQEKYPSYFNSAINRLSDNGFKDKNINTILKTNSFSRAAAIIDEASKGDYGTIVMGRRGMSRITDFSLGRVTSKVIGRIKNRALWVIP